MEKFQLWGDQDDGDDGEADIGSSLARQDTINNDDETVVVIDSGGDALAGGRRISIDDDLAKQGPPLEKALEEERLSKELLGATIAGRSVELGGKKNADGSSGEYIPPDGSSGTPMAKKRTTFARLGGAVNRMKGIQQAFVHLTNHCRHENDEYMLGSQEQYQPVADVQNILQDLELDMEYISWRKTITYPEDGDESLFAKRLRDLCAWMNTLMEAFVLRYDPFDSSVSIHPFDSSVRF
jgi:hypothetical protein